MGAEPTVYGDAENQTQLSKLDASARQSAALKNAMRRQRDIA